MAQYFGTARTNYFLVKDEEAFKAEMEKFEVSVNTQTIDDQNLYSLIDNDPDGGGMPWSFYNDETEEHEDIEWSDILGKHLADGQVCVLMESGAEKHRYISGYAVAFNNKGETRSINLNDIYDLAKELGTGVTQATY